MELDERTLRKHVKGTVGAQEQLHKEAVTTREACRESEHLK